MKSKSSVQQKKFYKLLQKSKTKSDPEKVILNFSKYVLSDIEKKLLAKGLKFCLPPKQLKYADYLVHSELFYRDILNLEILSNEDLNFVKAKTKETALSSFRQYNKNPKQNLSKEELVDLTNRSKNKDIVIQKSDKGNSAVIVDKDTCIKRMENLLSDQRKPEIVNLKNDAFLNFLVKHESTCMKVNSQVHGCHPFRPFLSALQTPTYNLAKFLVPTLNHLTKNEYIVKDSFQFEEEIDTLL